MSEGSKGMPAAEYEIERLRERLASEDLEFKFLKWFYHYMADDADPSFMLDMMQDYHAEDPKNIIPPDYIEEFIHD